ncbi:transglutaminase family protein [Persephonella sp.]
MEKIKVKNAVLILSYIVALTGFFSVFRFVDSVFSIFFLVITGMGIYFDLRNRHPLPRYVLNTVSLFVVGLMFLSINLENPVPPVVQTLLILLGIKILEDKKFRDFMQIYTISVFLLAGSAFMTVDMIFLLFFLILYFLVVISMVLLTFVTQDENISFYLKDFYKIVLRSVFIPILSVPATVIIFLILPRTEYPIFNFMNKQASGRSGFSDVVQLGDVSSIQEDSTVAFRVVMKKIDEKDLYWRGITLNYFDGFTWLKIPADDGRSYLKGKTVFQEIILEPQENRYLFGLDKPVKFYGVLGKMDTDISFSTESINFSRIKYRVSSIVTDSVETDRIDMLAYLNLPGNISEDIVNLAVELKGKTKTETLKNVIQFIEKNYKHSLEDLPQSDDPLREFLFNKRYGNCEYFASSVAVLLRINGIPTRLVVGYRGGYYNDIAGYYIVPQRFAHTWVEAYIDGKWIRVDPIPYGVYRESFPREFSQSVFHRFLETLQFIWINLVVNFDVHKQISLINKMRESLKKPDLPDINFYYLTVPFAVLLVVLVVISVVKFLSVDEEERVLRAFLKKMEEKGYKKKDYEGLEEFATRIDDAELKDKALKFVYTFESYYYRDKKPDLTKLKEILSSL